MSASDGVTWHPFVKVLKFDPDTVQDIITTYDLSVEPDGAMLADLMANDGLVPDNITEAAGNALVTVGKQRLSDLITGTGQAFTTTRGMVGVGDSSTATTAGMTSLQAGTNTYYQALDGAPGSSSGVITARSVPAMALMPGMNGAGVSPLPLRYPALPFRLPPLPASW